MVMEQEVLVVYILFNTVFFVEQNHCFITWCTEKALRFFTVANNPFLTSVQF